MEKGWPWPRKGGMALDATAELAVEAVADGPVAREFAPEWALRGSLPSLAPAALLVGPGAGLSIP
jgi:hypothetical protein